MLDNQIKVETPESIELQLIPVGPLPRILAYLIDSTIRFSILIGLAMVLAVFDEFGQGIYLVAYFIIDWFYCVLFEMLNDGKTPGKATYKIQVVHDDGTPLSWNAAMLRNFLRIVDFFPLFYLTGIISMCVSNGFKRLGDHAAGTLVVYCAIEPVKPKLDDIGSRPAPMLLEIAEQQAILAFAERSEQLSTARQVELAAILAPVLKINHEGKTPQQLSQAHLDEIKKIANGIIGQS